MASKLDFDEINRPEYEDWFDVGIGDEELKRRVKAAIAFDNRIGATLAWIERTRPGVRAMYDRFHRDYMDMLDDLDDADEEFLEERAIQFAEEVTKSTQRHADDLDGYWTSAQRAVEIAKNESGLVSNDFEYQRAKKQGKKLKTWHTMGDNKVRETHWPMDGVTVGIDEFFTVGGFDMLYPMDGEHGAPPEEIINCRCWVTYR